MTGQHRQARRALIALALQLTDGDRELAAVLLAQAAGVIADMKHLAGAALASQALLAAGGDENAAGAMLRGPLEAIGLLPYQSGTGNYHWGQP